MPSFFEKRKEKHQILVIWPYKSMSLEQIPIRVADRVFFFFFFPNLVERNSFNSVYTNDICLFF
jgi:hypothetical protein